MIDEQLNFLLEPDTGQDPPRVTEVVPVTGFVYVPNYISQEEEKELSAIVDDQPWSNELKRRVQHYGYKYDYRAKKIDSSYRLGTLPEWLSKIAFNLHLQGYMDAVADQVIINEYTSGQGISPHIDCKPCFNNTITSLSLCSSSVMEFLNPLTRQKESVFLGQRSLLVLKGDARNLWLHGIPARKTDKYKGKLATRGRRISITFRKVIIAA